MDTRILLCIDDTDDLDSPGTGELAEAIGTHIQAQGWGTTAPVTRHQLFIHPDIPYTSHNSSMCLAATIDDRHYQALIDWSGDFLSTRSAPDADPGLCVLRPVRLAQPALLIRFGHRAKTEVLEQRAAHELAAALGIHPSEHGGTGQGVIGALAGAALRLEGQDGRMRGTLRGLATGALLPVRELLQHPAVDEVRQMDGPALPPDALVVIGDKPKSVMRDSRFVLLVQADPRAHPGIWRTCTRQELQVY